MLRLKEVASQSETFSKRVGQKQNRNRTGLLARPADGRTPELFSIDRPPLLAVMPFLTTKLSSNESSASRFR